LANFSLTHLWDNKSIIFHFALLNIKLRFKNTYFGFTWAAIEPLLYFIVLYVVFSNIRERTIEDFPIYLITGIMFFHIFNRGTSGGIGSLINNRNILTSLNIQKEIFPTASTIAIAILAFVDVAVFFTLMPFFQFIPSWTIILLPIPLFLLFLLIQGLNFLLSIVNVYARDIQHFWIIFTHTLFFVTPIFWYLKDVNGILLTIHQINPLSQLIEIAHQIVIYREVPPLADWLYSTLLVIIVLVIGYAVFQKLKNKVIEQL